MVNEVAFVKLPVPDDVQVILLLLVALDPAVMFIAPASEHVD